MITLNVFIVTRFYVEETSTIFNDEKVYGRLTC